MNVIGSQDNPVSPEVWEEPDVRQAVTARDISTVYRLLRRVGVSQRQIAALGVGVGGELVEHVEPLPHRLPENLAQDLVHLVTFLPELLCAG